MVNRMVSLPRAVPDVIIGGAPRSGTTFLCEVLARHPRVFIPRPFAPEPKVCLTPATAGKAGLLARYDLIFGTAPAGAVRIEKTANYFENSAARNRIADLLPDVKLIFILREPVARAYSNWAWSRQNGLEPLSFAEAILQEGRRVSPFSPEREHVRPFDYMIRGQYGTFAEAWIKDFGRERIAFVLFEDALLNPEVFASRVQLFVGVEPLSWDALRTGKINATEPDTIGLDRGLERALRERIAPEVLSFSRATGIDVSAWGY